MRRLKTSTRGCWCFYVHFYYRPFTGGIKGRSRSLLDLLLLGQVLDDLLLLGLETLLSALAGLFRLGTASLRLVTAWHEKKKSSSNMQTSHPASSMKTHSKENQVLMAKVHLFLQIIDNLCSTTGKDKEGGAAPHQRTHSQLMQISNYWCFAETTS